MKQNDISGEILGILSDLFNKKRVVLIGQTSSWTKINAGVQQESILGSSIFLIYKNNSSDKLSFKAKIFPDNTAVFSVVHEPSKQDQDIVGRGFLTPLFYEDSPILLTLLFSNFVPMGDHAIYDLLFYLVILWIYTCQGFIP